MESWLSYLTFGLSGTGGWSNGDGLIHCVKRHYDLKSESFRVSLLKHEAQHASDQSRYPCSHILSLIHISEPTRPISISYLRFLLKKKN